MNISPIFKSLDVRLKSINTDLSSSYGRLITSVKEDRDNAISTWRKLGAVLAKINNQYPRQYRKACKKVIKGCKKTPIAFPSFPNKVLPEVLSLESSLVQMRKGKRWMSIIPIIQWSSSYYLFSEYIKEFAVRFESIKPAYSTNVQESLSKMEDDIQSLKFDLDELSGRVLDRKTMKKALSEAPSGIEMGESGPCTCDTSRCLDTLLRLYRSVADETSTILTKEDLKRYEMWENILDKDLFTLEDADKSEGIPYGYEIADLGEMDTFIQKAIREFYPDNVSDNHLMVPVFSPFRETNAMSVQYSDACYKQAAQMINAHTIATLSHSEYPIESIVCIDPHRRGTTFQNLLQFNTKSLTTVSVEYIPGRIKEALETISEIIHDRITNKLGSKYSSFEDYNKENPADPIDLLIVNVMDFPYGFSNDDISQLSDIILQGEVYGVMVTVGYNVNEIEKLTDIESRREQLYFNEAIANTDLNIDIINGLSDDSVVVPFQTPEQDIGQSVQLFKAQMDAIFKERSKGVYNRSIILPPETKDCKDELLIPIGESAKNIVNLSFGKGSSHHALIGGATGSGKSTLLHTIICGLIGNYSPDDVNLYLLDFKNGTEFKIYDRTDIPHIKCLAIDAMAEFGESILEGIIKEMKHRSVLFKSLNQHNLSGYIQASGQKMPRIVLVIDEFQVLFERKNNGKIAANCARYVKSITTEGRSYGIHLIMSTQTFNVMEELTLSTATVEQMRVRIGMKCNEKDTRYLFKDFEESAYPMMKGPIGKAVMSLEYTESDPRPLRVFYINDLERATILDAVAERDKVYDSTVKVFEGDRQPVFPAIERSDSQITLPIGEPVAIKPPISIELTAKRKQNVAIFGPETEIKTTAENLIKKGLALNDCSIHFIDGGMVDLNQSDVLDGYKVEGDAGIVRLLVNLNEELAKRKQGISGKPVCVLVTDVTNAGVLGEVVMGRSIDLDEFIDMKESAPKVEPEAKKLSNEATKEDILAYFYDTSDLDAIENSLASSKTSYGSSMTLNKIFYGLLQDGPRFGIHFILTSDDVKVFKNNAILDNIAYKLMFSLNENDAYTFLGDLIKCTTNEKVVYYRDGIKLPCLCKMYDVTES